MQKIKFSEHWENSWKQSFTYDLQEVYGQYLHLGYTYAYQCRQQKTLELLKKYVAIGTRILDVAAAQGNFSLLLAEMGYKVTWNDIRKELQGYVELKREHGTLYYAPGNIFELSFEQLFDAILITEIIEHVAHPNKFLKQIANLVKDSGYIVMTTPNGKYFKNKLPKFSQFNTPEIFEKVQFGPNSDDHIFLLHSDEISHLAKQAGLEITELRLGTNFLTNGHIKTKFLLHILPKNFVFFLEKLSSKLPFFIQERIMTNMIVVFQKKLGRAKST